MTREKNILYLNTKYSSIETNFFTIEKECAADICGIKIKCYVGKQTQFNISGLWAIHLCSLKAMQGLDMSSLCPSSTRLPNNIK